MESLEELMRETEINNSFDIASVSDTLKKTLENSFWYLYRLQRNMIRFKEYYYPNSKASTNTHVPCGDLYVDDQLRICMQIDADLVKQTARDKFYSSSLYKNEFTLEDIENHPELFERTLLLAVDRRYLFNYKIRMDNGITTIILPYKTAFLNTYDHKIINHRTSVILVDNECYKRISIHKGTLDQMSEGYDGYMMGPTYAGVKSFRTDGTYLAFVEFPDDNETSSLMNTCSIDGTLLKMEFSARIASKIQGTTENFIITLVFMKDMYEHTLRAGEPIMASKNNVLATLSTQVSVIEREESTPWNMPIPTENTLVLKRISEDCDYIGEYEPFDQSGTVLHYPNMYSISDPNMTEGDIYRLFYFYRKGYDLHYTQKFDYFFRYLKKRMKKNTLEEAVNKVYFGDITDMDVTKKDSFMGVFRKLFNYEEYNHIYDTIDFAKKYYGDETPYEYRVNRLKEFIKDNTAVLTDYTRHQNKVPDSYFLYISRIDLSKRERLNTSKELSFTKTFDEPHYLFLFQNPDTLNILQIRIWIDGLLCMEMVHENEFGMDYIYIPTRLINRDSYIEMEVFHSYSFKSEMYFPDAETFCAITIDAKTGTVPTLSDVMFYDKDDPSKTYPLSDFEVFRVVDEIPFTTLGSSGNSKADYRVIAQFQIKDAVTKEYTSMDGTLVEIADDEGNPNGTYYSLDGILVSKMGESDNLLASYTSMDKILVRSKTTNSLHHHIYFTIRKNAYYVQTDYNRVGYPLITLDGYRFNPDPSYYRIFKNGRLMPKTMYILKDNFSEMRLQMLFDVQPGDHFALDITPHRNVCQYFIEEIPSDGVVDLTGVLDKPFDPLYYDVYVNGRKLNETQVFAISDVKIKLINTESLYHMEIYQRDRDEEYFGWTKNTITWYFTLENLFSESFITDDEKKSIIQDIVEKKISDMEISDLTSYHEPVNIEEKNCDDDVELDGDLRFKIFYYEELLPNRLGDPLSAQFNNEYLKSEYPEEAETYLIEDSEIAKKAMNVTMLYTLDHLSENVLYLDPDINAETATTVYMLGDYDDICEELEKAEKERG